MKFDWGPPCMPHHHPSYLVCLKGFSVVNFAVLELTLADGKLEIHTCMHNYICTCQQIHVAMILWKSQKPAENVSIAKRSTGA